MARTGILVLLILLAACGRKADEQSPDMTSNIANHAAANVSDAQGADNGSRTADNPVESKTPPPASAPAALVPASLQGQWTGIAERCGDRAAALELTVEPDRLIFHESVGTVTSVRQEEGGTVRVAAAFSGEGQSWSRTLTLKPAADGRTMTITNDGTATTRKRC